MLLHDTLKSVVIWHSYKIRCYTAIFLQNFKLFTKSPNTILSTICKNSKYYFSNYLQKSQILFWQIFIKTQYYFGNYLQKSNTILTTIYKSPMLFWQRSNTILAHSIQKAQDHWANNYSTKAQILFDKIIILCSKPKTILWQKHILTY